MAYDNLNTLAAAATITATTTGSWVQIPGGTPPRGLNYRYRPTAITGDTVTPVLQYSADGTNVASFYTGRAMTAAGVQNIPVRTNEAYKYVRLVQNLTATTGSVVHGAVEMSNAQATTY